MISGIPDGLGTIVTSSPATSGGLKQDNEVNHWSDDPQRDDARGILPDSELLTLVPLWGLESLLSLAGDSRSDNVVWRLVRVKALFVVVSGRAWPNTLLRLALPLPGS
jgi:hypothetical protein